VSHLGSDLLDQEAKQGFDNIVRRSAKQQYIGRSREEMMRFFTGTDLVDPGLVRVEEWNPDPDPSETAAPPSGARWAVSPSYPAGAAGEYWSGVNRSAGPAVEA
jgi:hypothetical protein